MKRIVKPPVLFFGLLIFHLHAQTESPASRTYEESLNEFFEVSGSSPKDASLMARVSNIYSAYNIGENDMLLKLTEAMLEKLIPIDKANYGQKTLEDLIVFFKSPSWEDLCEYQ